MAFYIKHDILNCSTSAGLAIYSTKFWTMVFEVIMHIIQVMNLEVRYSDSV